MRKQIQIEKVATLHGHRDSVYRLEQGETPATLYSAGGDGFVAQWDLSSPKDGHLMCQVKNSVYAIRYVPELERLVVAQNHQGLHIIDSKTKKEERSLFLAEVPFFDIQYDQDRLYVGAGDGSLFVIQVSAWKVIQRLRLSANRIRTIQITDQYIITGSSDDSIRVLDKQSLEVVTVLQKHFNSVFSMVVDAEQKYFFSTGRDAHIRKWQLKAPFEEVSAVPAHMYAINSLSLSPDGAYMISGSLDKSLKVWRVSDLKLLKVVDKGRHAGHGTSINTVLWTRYQDYLVSGSDDRNISVWKSNLQVVE